MTDPLRTTGRHLAVAWLLLAMAAGASCSPKVRSRPPWPPDPASVEVRLREYSLDFGPTVHSGRVVFRLRNVGSLQHELQLVPLTDDFPPIGEQLRGSERRIITPLAGVPYHRPGAGSSFAVDLVEGRRYALVCFLRDADGSHAVKGMNAEFRAGGPPSP